MVKWVSLEINTHHHFNLPYLKTNREENSISRRLLYRKKEKGKKIRKKNRKRKLSRSLSPIHTHNRMIKKPFPQMRNSCFGTLTSTTYWVIESSLQFRFDESMDFLSIKWIDLSHLFIGSNQVK